MEMAAIVGLWMTVTGVSHTAVDLGALEGLGDLSALWWNLTKIV